MRPEVVYTSETDRRADRRTLRSHVVPLGIDLERFANGRRVLEGRIVGNVARLAEQKGHRDLIAAAPLVLERHPDVRFVVAGDGELRDELDELARPWATASSSSASAATSRTCSRRSRSSRSRRASKACAWP